MNDAPSPSVRAGQAIYSPIVLKSYDLWVLGISNHWIWRCPTKKLRGLYDRNLSECHLDVGVGTGYFLKAAKWPVAQPQITLLDLNPHSLSAAAGRIAQFAPMTVQADVLTPLPDIGPFRSVGLCYLLHCLPGAIGDKAVVFDHLKAVMAPGGKLFGATIMQGRMPRSRVAQTLMNFYNDRGIFSNAKDCVADLDQALGSRFCDVSVETSGCVALFEARNP